MASRPRPVSPHESRASSETRSRKTESLRAQYLLKASGYLQVAIGALIWIIATDVVRYRSLVITTIVIFLVGAPVFYMIDAHVGLPHWWRVMDFISCFLCGAFPLGFCLWPAKTTPARMQPTAAGSVDAF